MEVVGQIWNFLRDRTDAGITPVACFGARRSSKTWTISQFLLNKMHDDGDVVIFASMTENQGDTGAYNDCKDIIADNPAWTPYFIITSSPRRILCTINRNGRTGRAVFRSYKNAATAKGAACDWVYINEANEFTLQQYYALTANARKGVIIDYNPEDGKFWADQDDNPVVAPENRLLCKWQWNRRHLTPVTLKWFDDLKTRGLAPNASSADVAFYRRYYLGMYAEIYGDIFTPANIVREKVDVSRLRAISIIADPSNLTGADYFSSVCVGTDGARLYIIDTFSENTSSVPAAVTDWAEWCKRWEVVLNKWREWVAQYGVRVIFIESNGVGQEFFRYAKDAYGGMMKPFASSENKHKRIQNNYNNIINRVVWNDTPEVDAYLTQVYAYSGKEQAGLHDDNIDCVSSAFDIYYKQTRFMQ